MLSIQAVKVVVFTRIGSILDPKRELYLISLVLGLPIQILEKMIDQFILAQVLRPPLLMKVDDIFY